MMVPIPLKIIKFYKIVKLTRTWAALLLLSCETAILDTEGIVVPEGSYAVSFAYKTGLDEGQNRMDGIPRNRSILKPVIAAN
jgi:hypothetical protein